MHLRDFASTFGDILLGHLYQRAGGDGRRQVRIEPYRAAIAITGQLRPTRGDVRHLDQILRVLVELPPEHYRVARCPDVDGAFLIQPMTSPSPSAKDGGRA